MDRVLVTGGAGFVGAALVRALVEAGDEVHAAVHPRTDLARLAPLADRVAVHRVDLTDLGAVAPLVRATDPRLVFHAAARGGHPTTPAARVDAWRETVMATAVLLEALRDAAVARFVHVGSSLEYRPADRPLRESDPLEPVTVRGAMKAATTVAVWQWARQTGTPTTVVRPFSVYGPGEQPGRLVPTLLACLRDGTPFRAVAGAPRRDFVHVDDVVEACVLAARAPGAAGRALNVGTGVETAVAEVVELAQRVTGRRLTVDPAPHAASPADVAHWAADMSTTQEVLGWRPSVDLAEGLRRTYAAGCGCRP